MVYVGVLPTALSEESFEPSVSFGAATAVSFADAATVALLPRARSVP